MKRVVLITGSREGIGFQTALQLASRQWTVLMADKFDLEDSKNKICARANTSSVRPYQLDLGCFDSIRKFAIKVNQDLQKLDVLINNAGIFESKEEHTVDGFNPVMQINHLGPCLLTVLLAGLLKKSAPSRIIFVTSSGAFLSNLTKSTLPNLHQPVCPPVSYLDTLLTYYNAKLCNMIVSKELALRLRKHGVTCNCLHPGMTTSNFLLKGMNVNALANIFVKLTTQNPEVSADMVTFLATSRTLCNITGEYFANYQQRQPPKLVEDPVYSKKVWEQAVEAIKLTNEEKI